MDLVIFCAILIGILVVFLYFKLATIKSWYGQYLLRKANYFLLKSEDYYLMKNVVFLTFDGLQKFDYLVVSRFGVFVVMVQHYSGMIEGTEYEKVWTQTIRGKQVKQFSNPIEVINERVGTICGLLSLNKSQVFPVVLFAGISGFKNQLSNKITFGNQYLKYIRSKNKLMFSSRQIEQFLSIIEEKRKRQGLVNDFDVREKQQQMVSPLLQENTCPLCGSSLVIQESAKTATNSSQQLVCQLYPTCRYTRTIQ
jgi:restriction system protein